MRIAVINWSRRRVGGTETYLSLIIPELARLGHSLAFWHETDKPRNREEIALPEGVPSWCVENLGERRALAALRDWRPDLIYTHKLMSPHLEAATLKIAPAVFFAHDYYGTCISGAKTFKSPQVTPCSREFGWKCLLHYYPHRCGGLSPITMLRLFHLQSQRLKLLHEYKAILTHSQHMRAEYLKHGLPPERVYNPSYYAHGSGKSLSASQAGQSDELSFTLPEGDPFEQRRDRPAHHLLFSGRMDLLKGGRTLIEALPQVRDELGRPLRVTFAGDGPDRAAWERKALKAQRRVEGLRIEFAGWVERTQLDSLYEDSDLLVFPSLWPEPFGLSGPEAGFHGVPVAAFDVGGVSDWLIDGVNGHLAPGDPPTAEGLAQAIIECLQNPATYNRLRHGAVRIAQQFNLKNHLAAIMDVFENIVHGTPDSRVGEG
ncbi:MAG: glycosyltransferase family 4 protein [Acidobacteria bacterium]|nr:glycosyltransferase family 4 protein [Acidobacteriota bacterium]